MRGYDPRVTMNSRRAAVSGARYPARNGFRVNRSRQYEDTGALSSRVKGKEPIHSIELFQHNKSHGAISRGAFHFSESGTAPPGTVPAHGFHHAGRAFAFITSPARRPDILSLTASRRAEDAGPPRTTPPTTIFRACR
jgi:hypothetical protein